MSQHSGRLEDNFVQTTRLVWQALNPLSDLTNPPKALVREQNYSWGLQIYKTQSAERGDGSFAFSYMKSYYKAEATMCWDN